MSEKQKHKPTPEQQLAIDSNGRILVSASAGSGKTTTLVQRIIRQIKEGASLKRMLILVYNNAAADELREKLRTKLFETACEGTGDIAIAFRKELDEIPFAEICTIHAFCKDLIRRNFELLGISPSFRVLDETAHKNYMAKAFDALVEEYSEKDDAVFERLTTIFECKRSEENIRKFVYTLYGVFDVQPDKEAFIEKIKACYADRKTFDETLFSSSKRMLEEVYPYLENVLPVLDQTKQIKYAENAQIALRAIDVFLENGADVESVCKKAVPMLDSFVKAVKSKGADENSIELVKKCLDKVKKELNLYKTLYENKDKLDEEFAQNAVYATKLIELTCRFTEILDERKRADDAVSFGDLEHFATALINENPDRDFAEDFDYVFVDEYQDVNPVQEKIISEMVKKNAFFVGDVKQSIYGFRLADPDIFLRRKNAYRNSEEEDCLQIDFNDNFRSENQILEFVNGVFDVMMTEKSAGVDYKNDGRFSSRGQADGRVEVHIFNIPAAEKNSASGLYDPEKHVDDEERIGSAEEEGAFIARKIKELTSSSVEKISYGDIALLFRNRNAAAERIISKLRAYGIPVNDGSFVKDKDSPEKDLISLLTVIDNPRQDFALAGYLLSYPGGYTEDEVAEIARARDEYLKGKSTPSDNSVKADLYEGMLVLKKSDSALGDKVRATLEKLDEYRLKASFKNVGELISGIITDSFFDAYTSSYGDARRGGLNAFVAEATSTENGDRSLSAFLKDYKNNSEDKKNGSSSGGDKVQISTFHGYKGLESKVVFVSSSDTAIGRSRSADLTISSDGLMGLSYFNEEGKSKNADTLSKIVVKRLIEEKEYKEELRLAYVALTRAQKYMYVTGCLTGKDYSSVENVGAKLRVPDFENPGSMFGFVFKANELGGGAKIYLHLSAEDSMPAPVLMSDANAKAAEEGIGDYANLAKSIADMQKFEYAYKEDTRLAMKYSVSELDGEVDESTVRVFDDVTDVGTAYHKVMQYIDIAATDVGAEIRRMTDEGLLTEEERAAVNPVDVARALSTDIMKLAATSECLREQPFMMYKPAKEVVGGSTSDAKVLVQGVVDLVILGRKTGGENVIVDYKYSSLTNADAKKKYEKQLNLYKTAVENVVSGKVDRILLLSLKTGKTLEF